MLELDKDTCVGCQMCVKVCPHAVFDMHEKKAVIAHADRCIECGACQLNCHGGAIEVTKGTGCLFIIVREDILHLDAGKASCACA